jgi:hypothetical protein
MHNWTRRLARRYAVAWGYLIAVSAASVVYALLPRADQAAVLRFASTNVHNLHTDPVGCMVASAFFPAGSAAAWPALIALALFGACHVLGNWRTVIVCTAGHVIGTLVSEGILGYRVSHGTLPPAARFITDVGPSYVVVAAIAVGLLFGGWIVRAAAALDLAVLVFVGGIFSGLTRLNVAAVGHLTAIVTGAIAGALAWWQLRRSRAGQRAAAGSGGAGGQELAVAQDALATRDALVGQDCDAAAAGSRDSAAPARTARPDDEPRDPDQAAQHRPSA